MKVLDVSFNELLCDDSIQHLAHALRVNQGLKQLYVPGCSLTPLSAESLAEALTTNKHLEVLDISDNSLYDDGIQHLACALQVNHHLKYLDLANCYIMDVGFECLAKSIQDNNGLETLTLFSSTGDYKSTNLITEKVIPVLIECLKSNHTLTEIGLSDICDPDTSISIVNDVRKKNGLPLIEVCLYDIS